MQFPITLFYASLFAVFALILSAIAGLSRARTGVSVLHGEPVDMKLAEKVRRHQNFLEYVPMFLLVFAFLELNGAASTFLHITGCVLLAARIAHAVGLRHDDISHIGRLMGAAGTALITLVAACYGLWIGAPGVFG